MPLTVVIAPDSFKGSLTAIAAADAMARGWRSERPDDDVMLLPQADGGEGTLDVIAAAVDGAAWHSVTATGPDGRPVTARWLSLPDGGAAIEFAESSGIALMRELDPLGATSRGFGEVIVAALDAGATSLLIGLGGSASTDGGVGALAAIGSRAAPSGGVVLLTDVTSPLLGPHGSAAVFAPQKGATPEQVVVLERRLADLAARLGGDPTQPGAGAAGGAAFGLVTTWGARITPGSDYLASLSGLDQAVARADVVVTGEGRFDEQSFRGKVVGRVLLAAGQSVVIAGELAAEPPDLGISLGELAGTAKAAIAEPERWVERAGAIAAQRFTDAERLSR